VGCYPGAAEESRVAERTELKRCLIIGCGNTLRGDDGLGTYVVECLRGTIWPHGMEVQIKTLPQLDVTLASRMHDIDLFIFVDARIDDSNKLAKVERVEPASHPAADHYTSHTTSLPVLLGIARDWYGAAPQCWAVLPKGYDFAIGDTISDGGEISAAHAKDAILEVLKIFCDTEGDTAIADGCGGEGEEESGI